MILRSNFSLISLLFSAEAVSENLAFQKVSTGILNVTFYWGPVPDGVGNVQLVANGVVREDTEFTANFTYGCIDCDGSETAEEFAYLEINNAEVVGPIGNFTFFNGSFSFTYVGYNGNVTIFGPYYRFRVADIKSLRIRPALHWHGAITGKIYMSAREFLAPFPSTMSISTFSFSVNAVADLPLLTVPSSIVLMNETAISPLTGAVIQNLSAVLVDNVTANGAEYLSVFFSNVPENSRFSKGAPAGNGKC